MLTVNDLQFILQLISGSQLTVAGNQARSVAILQEKIVQSLNAANETPAPIKETPNGDSSGPTE